VVGTSGIDTCKITSFSACKRERHGHVLCARQNLKFLGGCILLKSWGIPSGSGHMCMKMRPRKYECACSSCGARDIGRIGVDNSDRAT
jgi:hypothetical protein